MQLHRRLNKKGVHIIGLSDEEDEKVGPFIKADKTPYYIASRSNSAKAYEIKGYPTFFVVNPAGKITYIGHDVKAAEKAVDKCLKETPPKSNEELEKEKAAEAVTALKDADRLYKDKELSEALDAYEAIVADYPQSPEAKKAKELAAKIKVELAESEAAEALTSADRLVDDKKYPQAMKAYEAIIEEHDGTVAAGTAKIKLKQLRTDKTIGKEIREAEAAKKCKGWLQMARGMVKNGKPDAARKYYEKIIEQFGDTSFAETAREEMSKL